jgi:hypothetical protein
LLIDRAEQGFPVAEREEVARADSMVTADISLEQISLEREMRELLEGLDALTFSPFEDWVSPPPPSLPVAGGADHPERITMELTPETPSAGVRLSPPAPGRSSGPTVRERIDEVLAELF